MLSCALGIGNTFSKRDGELHGFIRQRRQGFYLFGRQVIGGDLGQRFDGGRLGLPPDFNAAPKLKYSPAGPG